MVRYMHVSFPDLHMVMLLGFFLDHPLDHLCHCRSCCVGAHPDTVVCASRSRITREEGTCKY
jgi:hypothetical protein